MGVSIGKPPSAGGVHRRKKPGQAAVKQMKVLQGIKVKNGIVHTTYQGDKNAIKFCCTKAAFDRICKEEVYKQAYDAGLNMTNFPNGIRFAPAGCRAVQDAGENYITQIMRRSTRITEAMGKQTLDPKIFLLTCVTMGEIEDPDYLARIKKMEEEQ